MIAIIQAHDTHGDCHELRALPDDEAEARQLATRAAKLLSVIGSPNRWAGGRVAVIDATCVSGGLLFVSRITARRPVRAEGGAT